MEIQFSTHSGCEDDCGRVFACETIAGILADVGRFCGNLVDVKNVVRASDSREDEIEPPDLIWDHVEYIVLELPDTELLSAQQHMADCILHALGSFLPIRLRGLPFSLRQKLPGS